MKTNKLAILIIILISLCSCTRKEKPTLVKSISFTRPAPIRHCENGKCFLQEQDIHYKIKIIEQNEDEFDGILKIRFPESSKWRYVHGRFIGSDSLVLKDSLAVLDEFCEFPGEESSRLTEGEYAIKIHDDSIQGKFNITPTRMDSMFDRIIPPANSSFNGVYTDNDTLTTMEKDAWDMFLAEKELKIQYDSLHTALDFCFLDYSRLSDSTHNKMQKLAMPLLKSGHSFFEKYQHSPDSITVRNDYSLRIESAGRLSERTENDLQPFLEFMKNTQPEGSPFYILWNVIALDAETGFAWDDFKQQENPEFQGERLTKEQVAHNNYTRTTNFCLSVNPLKIHPKEMNLYYVNYVISVLYLRPFYADTLVNILNEYQQRFPEKDFSGRIKEIRRKTEQYRTSRNIVGNLAPNFVEKDIYGHTIDLSSFKGKVVFLEFWFTRCGPCRGSIPHLQTLYEKYHDDDFVIIGVAPDTLRDVVKMCREKQMPWLQVIPEGMLNSKLIVDYGVTGYPTGYLLDKNGVVVQEIRANDKNLDFLIQQYLNK